MNKHDRSVSYAWKRLAWYLGSNPAISHIREDMGLTYDEYKAVLDEVRQTCEILAEALPGENLNSQLSTD